MSAAATAAGYLYASGRLRGRGARENEPERKQEAPPGHAQPGAAPPRRQVRVAAYRSESATESTRRREATRGPQEEARPEPPRRVPKVQYRTRRWRPE